MAFGSYSFILDRLMPGLTPKERLEIAILGSQEPLLKDFNTQTRAPALTGSYDAHLQPQLPDELKPR